MMRRTLIGLGATMVLASGAGAASLAGSEWRPVEIVGEPAPEGVEIFLQFRGEGAVAGSGGCNRFTGTFETDGTALSFGPLATTRRACPPPLMEAEARFLGVLAEVRGYERDRIDLELTGADGTVLMRLAQTDAD